MSRLIDWESVCLVCLQKGENRYIFGEDNDSNVIADKIMKCSDILIKRESNRPKNICFRCLDDLNVAYRFRQNCEQSESIIKALVNANHQEVEIKDLLERAPITVNPTLDICIKHEVLDNAEVENSCEDRPCLDVGDPDTEDRADTRVHINPMEINNVKASESNEIKQEVNCKISKRSLGGQSKNLTEVSFAKPLQIVDNPEVSDISEDIPCLYSEDDPSTEAKLTENRADAMELHNLKASEVDKTKQEMNRVISRRPRGRPKKASPTSAYKRPLKICGICNRGLRGQNRFNVHMRRHNNERPFNCDHCDKSFVTSTELRRHVIVHTGQKPLKCKYCDRRFSDYGVKKNHESTHTGERPYKCPICNKSFAYPCFLTVHLRTHTGEKKFMCKECGKGFMRKERFEKHLADHQTRNEMVKSSEHIQEKRLEKEIFQIEENPNSNEINIKHEIVEDELIGDHRGNEETSCCDLKGGPISETKNDRIIQLPNAGVPKRSKDRPKSVKVCEICNHGFRDQSSLDDHIRRHNNERRFACDQCDKAFVTSTELRRHMGVHTGQKRYKCQYCDRQFSDYSARKNHESKHTGERPFKCPTCLKTFAYSNGLTKHLRTHTGVKKFECKECGKEFTRKEHFEKHVAHHLARDDPDKLSEPKQKKRLEKEIFQIEENVNSNEINIKHEIVEDDLMASNCDNENTCRLNLKDDDSKDDPVSEAKNDKIMGQRNGEVLKRSKERPKSLKVCKICNHGFRDQSALDDHIRRHNNERPFSCDQCDKAFVRLPELRRHMRVHTGQKPYKCRYCDRRFSYSSVRQNHESKHTGEKPYKCPTCDKSFATYSKGLMKHIRIHNGEKNFVCKECGREFARKELFEKHVAHHLTRDELDKSSEHKQGKRLENEIVQIRESPNSKGIIIKHEMELIEDKLN